MKITLRKILICLVAIYNSTFGQIDDYNFEFKIGKPIISSNPTQIRIAANQFLYVLSGSVMQKSTLTGDVLLQWGGEDYFQGNGKFNGTKSLATDENSNVYVLDSKFIQKFDENGNFIKQWTAPSTHKQIYINNGYVYAMESNKFVKYDLNGEFVANISVNFVSSAYYFCVDKNENFYVSQTYEVSKYNSSGTLVKNIGSWPFSGAGIIELDLQENIYVQDNFDIKIKVFSPTSSTYNRTIGAKGYGPAYFQSIGSITFDKFNNTYVCDGTFTNSSIQKFLANGTFSSMISYTDFLGDGHIKSPNSVAVDSKGNIFVSDAKSIIQKFDKNGSFIKQWGGVGNTDNTFGTIGSLCIDNLDRVIVADVTNRLIKIFDNNGVFITKYTGYKDGKGGVFSTLNSVHIDQKNYLYINSYGSILKYSPDGVFLKSFAGEGFNPGQLSMPIKKIVVENDRIYVLDRNYIHKFDTSGAFISNNIYSTSLSTIIPIDSSKILGFTTDSYFVKYNQDDSFNKSWKNISGMGDSEFIYLINIFKDRFGKIYCIDNATNTVKVFSKNILSSVNEVNGVSLESTIYPNPSNGKLKINFNHEVVKTTLYNQLGQSEIYYSNEFETSLKGLVFIEIETKSGQKHNSKIIIE